jgi:hypothetical protein
MQMTKQEILANIKALPVNEQFELATNVLEELALSGEIPVSETTKRVLDNRIKEADKNPESLIPSHKLFDDLADG